MGFLRWIRLVKPLGREMRLVLRRAIRGVGPDPAAGVGLVEQAGQLRAVVAGGVGGGPGADQPVAAVDADMVLVAEHRDGDVDALRAVRRRLGLGVFHRPARVAVLLRQLGGLRAQASGMRPSFSARFSSSVLRCFGAATTVASTICPPMAM